MFKLNLIPYAIKNNDCVGTLVKFSMQIMLSCKQLVFFCLFCRPCPCNMRCNGTALAMFIFYVGLQALPFVTNHYSDSELFELSADINQRIGQLEEQRDRNDHNRESQCAPCAHQSIHFHHARHPAPSVVVARFVQRSTYRLAGQL